MNMQTAPLAGKVAVVTGGSRSLGKAISLHLATLGADVILTYRTQAEAATSVVADIEALGQRAHAIQVDLTGIAEVPAFAETVQAQLTAWEADGFDILINNAGVTTHAPFADVSESEFDRVWNINFKSVYFVTQHLLPSLHDGGRIINIGTGLTRFTIPGLSVYAPIKAALESFTKYLAKELGARQITVNTVAPGALDTDFNAAMFTHNPQMLDYISSVTTLGRVGLASDIDQLVGFLATDGSRWITGERIEASGGMFL